VGLELGTDCDEHRNTPALMCVSIPHGGLRTIVLILIAETKNRRLHPTRWA